MDAIILSKDRACQTQLLIDSLDKNSNGLFERVFLYFTYSNEDYFNGYIKLRKRTLAAPLHFKLIFVDRGFTPEETKFKDYLLEVLYKCNHKVCFFTDDDIFYREPNFTRSDVNELFDDIDICTLSLRLGKNTLIQDIYTNTQSVLPNKPYKYGDKFIMWPFRSIPPHMNFGYPLSVDGHIYCKGVLINVLKNIEFNHPNDMEGRMASQYKILNPVMACPMHSLVVNTPLNRVQDIFQNRNGEKFGLSQENLNTAFINGQALDLNSIKFDNIICTHQELEIGLKNGT